METLYACSVISTVDNAVCTNLLFIGEEKATIASAEKAFLEMIKDEISGELSQESLEQHLDDGYAISGSLCICINHPSVKVTVQDGDGNPYTLDKCECDNTHEANDTVCRWCFAMTKR